MIRALRLLLAATFAFLLLVLAVFVVAVATPAGSAWLLQAVTGFTDRQVQADDVSGTLLRGLSIGSLTVDRPTFKFRAEGLDLQVFWPDLLRERFTLGTAAARVIRLELIPDPKDRDEPVQPLLLPFALEARALSVERLEIVLKDREPVVIRGAAITGELNRGILDFERLAVSLYGVDLEAKGAFGTGEPYGLDALVQWQVPDAEISGAGSLNGNLVKLRFHQTLRVPDEVIVTGTARLLGDDPHVMAEASWQEVTRDFDPEADTGNFRSRDGRLQIAGWTGHYEGRVAGDIGLDDWPELKLQASGSGNLEQLDIRGIRARGLNGTIRGNAQLRFGSPVTGTYALEGKGLDPSALNPRARGRIEVAASGSFDSAGQFTARVERSAGELMGRPFQLTGTVRRAPPVLFFDDIKVAAGNNRAKLTGRWDGNRPNAEFSVDAPELGILVPGLGGSLRGSGKVAGSPARPEFSVDLVGANLVLDSGETPLRVARFVAQGGVSRAGAVDLDVTAEDTRVGSTRLGNLSFAATGRLASHDIRMALTGADATMNLRGEGTWARRSHSTRLTEASVSLRGDQRWNLRDPALLQLTASELRLSAHCWDGNGTAELCATDIRADAASQEGGINLRRFPIAALNDLKILPKGLRLDGIADIEAIGSRSGERLTGRLRWDQNDTTVTYRTEEGDELSTTFETFQVAVDGTDEAVDYRANIKESFGGELTATGRILSLLSEEPQIAGRIVGQIPDLSRLAPVIESQVDVGDVKGGITVDATVAGPLAQPLIVGGLKLEDGQLSVPLAGITVDRIQLSVIGQPDGRARIKGSARSGKGYVELGGALDWRNRLLPAAEVTIRGRNLEVIRLPEGTVQVSPDVEARLTEGQFLVSGQILVPKADITIRQLGEGAVVPSPDTVVHGRELLVVEKRRPLFVLDGLSVRLGKNVRFKGFGLDTRLEGGLTLNQEDRLDPDSLTATGTVNVADGRFSVMGEVLTVERGNLIFSGVATNPGVDARASREVSWEGREITVGVILTGTLAKIQTRVFSEPAMGEMDALSYLTTGKPLSANTGGDRFSVANAALTLGLQGALPVAEKLGSALNVDDLGVAGSGGEGTEVFVGEQIGKDLYLRYSYGVFNKLGTIKATYRIGRRLSLEGSSGEEQALDLLYSVEW